MKTKNKQLTIVLVFVMLLTSSVTALAAPQTTALSGSVTRLSGSNRIETAIEISKNAYNRSNSVILAGTTGEADALTGTILARHKNAPLLLVSKNVVSQAIKDEIQRLGAKTVYILGGEGVVSKTVENTLKSEYNVIRIAGNNRTSTAIAIANEVNKGDKSEIFLTLGFDNLADALAIGPVSAKKDMPILLTQSNVLPKDTLEAIKTFNVSKITIIGGEKAVSQNVINSIPRNITVNRIGGINREDTALKIANLHFSMTEGAIVANGYTYADALVGGHLAAKNNVPILLSSPKQLGNLTSEYMKTKSSNGFLVTLLGGEVALSKTVMDKIESIVTSKPQDNSVPDKPDTIPPVKGEDVPDTIPNPEPTLKTFSNKTDLRNYITNELKNRNDYIRIGYTGSGLNNNASVLAFINEELLDLGTYYSSNISGYQATQGLRDNDVKDIQIKFGFRTTDAQETFINQEAKRIIASVTNTSMNEYQKTKAIHDYIVNNIEYTSTTTNDMNSPYTVFKERKGVTTSFALASARLFEEAGIQNNIVKGSAMINNTWSNGAVWNKVKVNNKWYNINSAWCAPMKTYGKHNAYYYFMGSDSRFSENHLAKSPNAPKATDTQYDGQFDGDYSKK